MARSIGIRVYKGDDLVDVHVFERDIVKIGRLASAHLRLEDPKVSRIHAVIDITADGEEVSIIDMGSAEGTRVNGDKVSRVRLKHGDQVELGDSRLVVLLDESEIAAAAGGDGAPAKAPEGAPAAEATELVTGRAPLAEELSKLPAPADTGSGVFAGNDVGLDEAAAEAAAMEMDVFTGSFEAPPSSRPAPPMAAAPRQVVAHPPQAAGYPPPGWVAPPLPPIPEDPINAENRHLEIALRWGGDVVEVKRLRGIPKFTIGSTGGEDLFIPLEGFASTDTFELVRQAQGSAEWQIRFTHQMSGVVLRGGQSTPLAASGAMMDGDAYALTVTDDMSVELSIGYFTLEIRNVSRSRAIPIPPFFDMFFINTAMVTLFSFASLMSVLVLFPAGLDEDDDALLTNPGQFQTLILKPPPKENSFLDKLKQKAAAKQAAKDKAGKAGSKKQKKTDQGRLSVKSDKKEKPTDEQVVAAKLNQLFGADGKSGIAQLFGADASGGELNALLGGISGSQAANAYGTGGLSFRGSGPGGGGTGTLTMGTGPIGTRGRGSGEAGYGSSEGGIGQKGDRDISVTQGTPIIYGSLDKEIIRRVVRENAAQIRYCYERELTRTPGLYGKITMKWIISGDGKVKQASVQETQMKNKAVESCLARRIKGWNFPKPKGGGIVVVTYPFVFKKSG